MRQGFHLNLSYDPPPPPVHTYLSFMTWQSARALLSSVTDSPDVGLIVGVGESVYITMMTYQWDMPGAFLCKGEGDGGGCWVNCVPLGSPAQASLTPTRQLQRPCGRAYGFRLHTYCVTSFSHTTLWPDLDNGHVSGGFQLQWSVTTATVWEIVIYCMDMR